MRNNDRETVAKNVKRQMKRLGWSQTELSRRSGIAQTTISYLLSPERGKAPTLETLTAVAGAFRVPTWSILVEGIFDEPIDTTRLGRVVSSYAHIDEQGRLSIDRIAEIEIRYRAEHSPDHRNRTSEHYDTD